MARPPDTPLRRPELAPDAIDQFRRWFADAQRVASMPEAMTLCTADGAGRPAGRMVLLKGISSEGFDFFTNYRSRKAQDLADNPHAALVLWWIELDRSVRIEGSVARLSAEHSDAYFQSRPRDSQIAALASAQSRPVAERGELDAAVARLTAEHDGRAVPRPAWWGGYRVVPGVVEFWQGRHGRLHDRFRYERAGRERWRIERLAP